MADIFAYNATGLSYSESHAKENRSGIIGNFCKLTKNALLIIESGYPTGVERDIFCKVFGKKPFNATYVEVLKSERKKNRNAVNTI